MFKKRQKKRGITSIFFLPLFVVACYQKKGKLLQNRMEKKGNVFVCRIEVFMSVTKSISFFKKDDECGDLC